MKLLFKVIAPLILAISLVACSTESVTNEITSFVSSQEETKELNRKDVTVNRVVDGDTVNVEMPNGTDESVRLLLIDTPESVHPDKPDQPYGEAASEFAKETLQEGQTVILETGDPERDKYDRLLGYIWINDDKNFNQLMIEKGYARVAYVKEPNTKYLDKFEKAEDQAEKKEENIWSIDGYVENEFMQ